MTRTPERFAPYQRCVLERYTPTPWTIAALIWNSGNRAELKKRLKTLCNMSLIIIFVFVLCLFQNVLCSVATCVSIYVTPYVSP